MKKKLKILAVEDNEYDVELCCLTLTEYGIEYEMQRVEDEVRFREALQSEPDLILCDYTMPRFSAPAALGVLKSLDLDIPFIVVSGTIGEDVAVAMMRDGAHDYILKNQLARLGPAILRELREAEIRRARQRSESEVHLLLQIAQSASISDDSDYVLQEALRAMGIELNWDYGEAWVPDPDTDTLRCSPIWWGDRQRFKEFRQQGESQVLRRGEDLAGWSWISGKTRYVKDLQRVPPPRFSRQASAAQAGLRAGLVLPIIGHNGKPITLLSFFTSRTLRPDARISRILVAVANQLSGAFQRLITTETLREREALLSSLADHVPGVIYQFKRAADGRYSIPYISRAVEDLYGYSSEEAMRNPNFLLSSIFPEDRVPLIQSVETSAANLAPWEMEIRVQHKNRAIRWIHGRSRPRPPQGDGSIVWDGLILDITDRKHAEQKLEFLTYHDRATGLANQKLLLERTGQAIRAARHDHAMVAIVTFSIDQYETVEQSLGIREGENLIQEVALRSSALAGEFYTAARVGGNQFALLMIGLRELDEAVSLVKRLTDTFATPVTLGQQSITLSISIGAATFPQDADNAESLLRDAGTALARVQDTGGNAYQFYTADMNALAKSRLSIESRLHQALIKEQFELFFQPQVSLDADAIIGVEALIRWRGDDGRLISPLDFIPLAEETGMIVAIGNWVLEAACYLAKQWHDEGLSIVMSVNLSPRQLRHPEIHTMISDIIGRTGVAPELLKLEITESAVMPDIDNALKVMHALREIGVKFTIDDFGTGYSSLNYLARLPVDSLKIDRSFVADMTENRRNARIVESIINLTHALDLYVVAEGVETPEQLAFLRAYGCDSAQGYLFYRPIDTAATHAVLQNTRIIRLPASSSVFP